MNAVSIVFEIHRGQKKWRWRFISPRKVLWYSRFSYIDIIVLTILPGKVLASDLGNGIRSIHAWPWASFVALSAETFPALPQWAGSHCRICGVSSMKYGELLWVFHGRFANIRCTFQVTIKSEERVYSTNVAKNCELSASAYLMAAPF